MEVSGYNDKTIICKVVDDHVVNKKKDNDDALLRWFGFNFFDEDRGEGCKGWVIIIIY